MKLPSRIDFNFATVDRLTWHPNKDGGKAVLKVRTPLTVELAENMGLREVLYETSGIAREIPNRWAQVCEPTDTSVRLAYNGGAITIRPELIHAFGIKEEDAEEGTQLVMDFSVHFAGKAHVDEVEEFSKQVNTDCFGIALLHAQTAFNFDSSLEAEKQEVQGCKLCDADTPLNEDGTEHVTDDGEVLPCLHPSAKAVAGKGSIASAGEMKRANGKGAQVQ